MPAKKPATKKKQQPPERWRLDEQSYHALMAIVGCLLAILFIVATILLSVPMLVACYCLGIVLGIGYYFRPLK